MTNPILKDIDNLVEFIEQEDIDQSMLFSVEVTTDIDGDVIALSANWVVPQDEDDSIRSVITKKEYRF